MQAAARRLIDTWQRAPPMKATSLTQTNGQSRPNGGTEQGTILYARVYQRSHLETSSLIPPPLPEYGDILRAIISSHHGTIFQTETHETVALFAAPFTPHHATQAALAALALVRHITSVNERRLPFASKPIRLSIGLDSGDGPATRHQPLDRSGARRRLARARFLSELNQQTPFPAAFLSNNTFRLLSPMADWHVENLGATHTPNEPEQLEVYAIMPPLLRQ